jgi:tellurite resistance protein
MTHGAALKALDFVSVLMAENVFVITATNKLMSQKLSTTMQVMKKKQDMKNSESITEYINDDHYNTRQRPQLGR